MSDFDLDMPDELQGGRVRSVDPADGTESRDNLLAQLGITIGGLRDEAVAARKESGVEDIWLACEEAYLGIDDSNRSESGTGKWVKPSHPSGPVTVASGKTDGDKSNAFVLLTSRYVDMGAAKVCEIALPIDDKAFSLDATPIPELITALESTKPVLHPQSGAVLMQPAQQPSEPGQPGQPERPKTEADVAQEEIDRAADSAEKSEKRIWDWMTECKYPAEMRTVLHDSARLGTGALKGPFPSMSTTRALSKAAVDGGFKLKMTIVKKSTLAAKWIDLWNLFPDPACGEDIHSGDHIFERDHISKTTLKRLKQDKDSLGTPIYLGDQIDKVIEEGPGKCNISGENPAKKINKNQFEIWYFTGTIKKSDMQSANAIGLEELPDEIDEVYAIITMVNDTVIRATVNPLESGRFPYRVLPWSRRAGSWTGVGVGEKVALAQRITNAGTRGLLNNAGVTSGSQIIIDPVGLIPANNKNTITPLKIWHKTPEAGAMTVQQLFAAVDIPNHGPQLMEIINLGMKMAEEASNISLIAQGQTGDRVPQTFGEAELQNSNSHTLLRQVGARIDDFVTEPLVNDFYEMLLLDPNIPDSEKGDCKINASGTSAMVEKAIQEQVMLSAGNLTTNPAFGINPRKWFAEYWKTKRLDPRKIQYTEEELAEQAKNPPPEAPVITAAKIRSQSAEKIAQGRDGVTMQKVAADTDRDTAYVNAEAARTASVQDHANRKLELEERIAMANYQIRLMDFAQQEKLSINDAKAMLADTAMRLGVQRELSAVDRTIDLHKHHTATQAITPAAEPAGRAEYGHAFEQ